VNTEASNSIHEVIARIAGLLAPFQPDRVILFGSYAWGTPGPDSDLDVYIVLPNERMPESWGEKRAIVEPVEHCLRELRQIVPMDILVHTRAMFRKFVAQDSLFAQRLLKDGKVLYDASN
jgi:predicted nucleotidyltransferase